MTTAERVKAITKKSFNRQKKKYIKELTKSIKNAAKSGKYSYHESYEGLNEQMIIAIKDYFIYRGFTITSFTTKTIFRVWVEFEIEWEN